VPPEESDLLIPSDGEISDALSGMRRFDIVPPVPTAVCIVGDNTLAALKDFADAAGIGIFFVERTFIDRDSLKIFPIHLKGLGLDILGGVQLDSHVYNRDMDSIDLSSPEEMRIYVMHEGRPVGIVAENPDLKPLLSVRPEERVAEFVEARRAKARERISMEEKKADPVHEKFSEVLVLDRQFRALTDDYERFQYVMKVARRPGNDAFKKSVLRPDGGGFSMDQIRLVLSICEEKTGESSPETKQMTFKQ